MITMTSQEVTEYLRQVATLESAIFKQKEIIKTANKNLKKRQISRPTLKTPKMSIVEPPKDVRVEPLGPILGSAFGLPFVGVGVAYIGGITGRIFLVIGLIILASGFISFWYEKKRSNDEYERQMDVYQRKKDALVKEYQTQMVQNQEQYEAAMLSYRQKDEIATINYQKAKSEVELLDKPLEEAERLLSQLYEKDIIFSKYRNMIAICTMYEYFAAGRCSELTGANGAYNMYEQELLQNRIINQLEQVNSNLEQIKQNQYILYQAICETNQALKEISDEVKGIVNAVTDIAVSSRITAYCSQLTAINTQAQTYIALLE